MLNNAILAVRFRDVPDRCWSGLRNVAFVFDGSLTLAIGPLCGAILVGFVTQSRAPNVVPLSAVKARQC